MTDVRPRSSRADVPPPAGGRYHPVPVTAPVPCAPPCRRSRPLRPPAGVPGSGPQAVSGPRRRTGRSGRVATAAAVSVFVSVVLAVAAPAAVPAGAAPGAGTARSVVASPQVATTVGGDDLILENPLGTEPGEQVGASADEDRKVWAVVGALVAVAAALTVLTVRYWRQTRPTGPRGGDATPAGRTRRRRGGTTEPTAARPSDPDTDRGDTRPAASDAGGDDDLDLDDLFVDD